MVSRKLLAKKYGLSRDSSRARLLYVWNIADFGKVVTREHGNLS
jgi:hypothetical protein